jgi:hypothetical protein
MHTPVDNMLNNMDWLECYYLLSDLCSKLPSLRSRGTFHLQRVVLLALEGLPIPAWEVGRQSILVSIKDSDS